MVTVRNVTGMSSLANTWEGWSGFGHHWQRPCQWCDVRFITTAGLGRLGIPGRHGALTPAVAQHLCQE